MFSRSEGSDCPVDAGARRHVHGNTKVRHRDVKGIVGCALTSLSEPYSKVRFRGMEVMALGRLKLGSDTWSGTM